MNPLISVIIPSYNSGHFLPTTLQAVLDQTFENWECIVINDGSTDNSEEILQQWAKKDSRFKYFTQKNSGRSVARNFGIQNAKGAWIQLLDADDTIEKTKFEKSAAFFNEFDIVICNYKIIENSDILPPHIRLENFKYNYESILLEWELNFTFPPHCTIIKKEKLSNVFFTDKIEAYEDWLFWLDFFKNNPKVHFLNEYLAYYHMHQTNTTKNKDFMYQQQIVVRDKIFQKLDSNYQKLFFERTCKEFISNKQKYEELIASDNVYNDLETYKRYKEKYYNIWYKKIFYKFNKNKNNK